MINIQKGDMFIDEQCGIGQPTTIICSHISKSWFRRKKPFAFICAYDKKYNFFCILRLVEQNKSLIWLSEKNVEDLFYVAQNSKYISYIPVEKE